MKLRASTKALLSTLLVVGVGLVLPASDLLAKDWYVSISRGKGKKGSKKKPAKDLGNIIKKLSPGDTVHIAGGVYLGKGQNGTDNITVPVSIIGGYNEDFSVRDPWGATKTIFSGDVKSKNYKPQPRIYIDLSKYRKKEMPEFMIDGIIVDQSSQNRYKTDKKQCIVRKANPKTGENPTPDRGAIVVKMSKTGNYDKDAIWKFTIQNCAILNSAPTQGAMSIAGYRGSQIVIRNNLIINNTGVGIYAGTMYHGDEPGPSHLLENNTVLFTWKYDAMASSFSGESLVIDDDALVTAKNNVFAFADRNGITKKGKEPFLAVNNVLVGNAQTDYYEAPDDAKIATADIEDEAEYLHEDSEGFLGEPIKVPVSEKFAKLYGSRVLIDRNAVEADIKPLQTRANALRSMLGLPLQAGAIKDVTGDVWLPKIELDDALAAGMKPYGDCGCSKP